MWPDLSERAALIGGLLAATERDLHRQVGDHQVHHPEMPARPSP
jgi:hypothetical protein